MGCHEEAVSSGLFCFVFCSRFFAERSLLVACSPSANTFALHEQGDRSTAIRSHPRMPIHNAATSPLPPRLSPALLVRGTLPHFGCCNTSPSLPPPSPPLPQILRTPAAQPAADAARARRAELEKEVGRAEEALFAAEHDARMLAAKKEARRHGG